MAWMDELNLPGSTITGRFGSVAEDGPDEDNYPDILVANGSVLFEPTAKAGRANGAWLGIQPVTARIESGSIVAEDGSEGVRLLATDANIGVADWAWEATFDIKGFTLAPLTFKAPRNTTVNLTADLIPIKSQPYQIIEGASIVDTEVDLAGERMRFKMSDGTYTSWVSVPNGEPGAKGDPGVKGDPGADGKSPTISMGAVSAGSSADAWLTGDPLARELNLTLPRGPRGDSGASTIEQVTGLAARLAAIEYDSGVRRLEALSAAISGGSLRVTRVGCVVQIDLIDVRVNVAGQNQIATLPIGFRPRTPVYFTSVKYWSAHTGGTAFRANANGVFDGQSLSTTGQYTCSVTYLTDDPIPTTLPGTPA